ncbi:hypothetical protein BZG01_17475 [Labilibaculum manganireducens]|uniref:DarT domain-containing protein n=1 Tax=Labilibaculum manganireducens TaxID=1940525 RepID=A0A2N3HWI8_9BACT|nr:DarT ssDNA thymidine ADP-ribosyltransferase family protein [Labilibaculum manganireducens]PKQ62424.1 hypothetical protein BZG01_17475 [Labilibaculum manganireducens]
MLNFKQDSDNFKQFISEREIEFLVHFTATKNLYSILENGKLMSRAKLESLDIEQFDILDYAQFTDAVRYDDTNYINLSISSTNSFLFSKFQERTKEDFTITWCVLKINPIYLYQADTLFSVTNAASSSAKRQFGISGDLEKLKLLFKSELRINTFNGERSLLRRNLPLKYPTDVQAEVLVKDEINSDYITEICFRNNDELAQAKAAMNSFDTSKFVVDSSIFESSRL